MPAGRPLKYKTAKELDDAIRDYFKYAEESGKPVMTTALAYSLGFESRQSLYDYKDRGEFSYIIKRALLQIEITAEENLINKGGSGEIFRLKNFGWSDKTEVDNTHTITGRPIINFTDNSKK